MIPTFHNEAADVGADEPPLPLAATLLQKMTKPPAEEPDNKPGPRPSRELYPRSTQ